MIHFKQFLKKIFMKLIQSRNKLSNVINEEQGDRDCLNVSSKAPDIRMYEDEEKKRCFE
jgi:hypothetical protein